SVARNLGRLDPPEQVGRIAAERTIRRLGARKAKTAHVPMILDPMVAASILEHIFEGVNGDSVYRGASFLAGKLGQKIAGENVTEFLGHGANLVTGDYSRGASGLWISGGELTYPVEEITVAGNLKEMFFHISEIANDLEFRGAVASPTIRIDGLTVGGE